jgi:hypothetical protein
MGKIVKSRHLDDSGELPSRSSKRARKVSDSLQKIRVEKKDHHCVGAAVGGTDADLGAGAQGGGIMAASPQLEGKTRVIREHVTPETRRSTNRKRKVSS